MSLPRAHISAAGEDITCASVEPPDVSGRLIQHLIAHGRRQCDVSLAEPSRIQSRPAAPCHIALHLTSPQHAGFPHNARQRRSQGLPVEDRRRLAVLLFWPREIRCLATAPRSTVARYESPVARRPG